MDSTKNITNYVEERFSSLGYSHKREVSRLLYEIAKKECVDINVIVDEYSSQKQAQGNVRNYLLNRRYPTLSEQERLSRTRLSALDINSDNRMKIEKDAPNIVLKNAYIEKDVCNTVLVKQLKEKYKDVNIVEIDTYAQECKKRKYSYKDYNNRLESFYFIKEKFDFFKKCPCSNKSVSCELHLINLGSGCAYECKYCFLQNYVNSPGIVIPANIEDFFEKFGDYKQDVHICSGEMTDSLVFDHITEYSPRIIKFFADYPGSSFEFKTKSDNIDLLLKTETKGNIIVSWSMNPQVLIDEFEPYTTTLEQRITAARKCAEAGYKIMFHFDPIIHFDGWQAQYKNVVDQIFDLVPNESIQTISLGTLRLAPKLKKIIENRFPEAMFLNDEFIVSYDGKLRYQDQLRMKLYSSIKQWIEQRSGSVNTYLCMEEKNMCFSCQSAPLKQFQHK